MNPDSSNVALDLLQALFRWSHLAAGIVWIGHLYFFNWVNAQLQPKLDAPTKKIVNPELLPRALWWFRWGAAWTWLTGFLLLFMLYYHGPYLLASGAKATPKEWLPGFAALFVGFVVFDLLFKPLKTGMQQVVGAVIWGAIVIGIGCVLDNFLHYSGRAIYIHMGAIFGTVMAANVWMRIWPAQRRIITAVKNGTAPDAKDVAVARDRSKHNTYMSVPLALLMVSNHHPVLYGGNPVAWQFCAAGVFVLGFLITYALYAKSAKVQGF